MKKNLLAIAGLLLSAAVYGQVGVNTEAPKASFHIVGKTIDGTSPEGIITPRLEGDALFAASGTAQYGTDQDGAIVYITSPVSPGNNIGQTVHINAPGYYYFDAENNEWKKVGDKSNIYNSDGTLANPRTMDMNNSTLGFVNGRVSMGTSTSHPSSILELQSITRGFLPPRMTKVQMDAIVNPALALIIYCTDCFAGNTGCLMINDSPDESNPKWGSLCSSNAKAPMVLVLNCAGTVTAGTLYSGQAASGVTSTVPYTGGNGGVYQAASFNSTGVTGLVANLPSGVLNNGSGNFVFNITGTPSAAGTATFTIAVAGQSCSFTIPVSTLTASVGSLNCGSAIFSPNGLTQGKAYNGTLTVPYTVGNGAAYPQSSFTQNGLTFTRPAGTLVNGNSNLVYNVIGIPTNAGVMSIPISFTGASTCNVSITVGAETSVVLPGNTKAWLKHNEGADKTLNPDIPVQGIHGYYYQWGKKPWVADTTTPPAAIAGWSVFGAANGAWVDGSKTTNDPCPTGFRVPTNVQWQNLINNNTQSNVGPFTNSPTNFGSAKVVSGGGKKLTFPAAGTRAGTGGQLSGRGNTGHYWSSTEGSSQFAYEMVFVDGTSSTSLKTMATGRANGSSVRCIEQ